LVAQADNEGPTQLWGPLAESDLGNLLGDIVEDFGEDRDEVAPGSCSPTAPFLPAGGSSAIVEVAPGVQMSTADAERQEAEDGHRKLVLSGETIRVQSLEPITQPSLAELHNRWGLLPPNLRLALESSGFDLQRPYLLRDLAEDPSDAIGLAHQLVNEALGCYYLDAEAVAVALLALAALARSLFPTGKKPRHATALEMNLENFLGMQAATIERARKAESFAVQSQLKPIEERNWSSRRRRLMAQACDSKTRLEVEMAERERWTRAIIDVMVAANLPRVQEQTGIDDIYEDLAHLAGKARAKTLRQRAKYMQAALRWLLFSSPGDTFFSKTTFVQLLRARATEPCGRTVPGSLLEALAFFEKRGGVPADLRVSANEEVQMLVDDLTLKLESTAPPTKKAFQPFLVLVACMEFLVVSTGVQAFWRFFAWAELVTLWTSMRSDDAQGLLLRTLKLYKSGLSATLDRTKTTGPGRRIRWAHIFLAREAWLVFPDWLQVGWELMWSNPALSFDRDYLVGLPDDSFEGMVGRKAEYQDLAGLQENLYRMLKIPETLRTLSEPYSETPAWEFVHYNDCRPLLLCLATGFLTRHSLRNLVNTLAALCGISKDVRSYLGRWGMEASDEYLRAQREMVHFTQRAVAGNVRLGDDRLTEEAIAEAFSAHIQALGADKALAERQLALLDWRRIQPAAASLAAAQANEDQEIENGSDDQSEATIADNDNEGRPELEVLSEIEQDELQDLQAEQQIAGNSDYVVKISKSNVHRLHRVGGCYHARDARPSLYFSAIGDASYDAVCSKCFTPKEKPIDNNMDDDNRSTGTTETDSSDEPIEQNEHDQHVQT